MIFFFVASSATALAPFSQNSAIVLWSSGSGQAQPGQSNPPNLLTLENELIDLDIPERDMPCLIVEIIAVAPAAEEDVFPVTGGLSSRGGVAIVSLLTSKPINVSSSFCC